MRKTIHFVHTSLDGYIEGPNGEFDWPVMSTDLSDYSFSLDGRSDILLYGRVVWDMMSAFWPHAESMSDDPHDLRFAPIWRNTQKVVVSRTLEKADWNTQVINGVEELAELKEQPGKDILLTGGAGLAASLTELGLIDEYHVVVHPVLLGGGKRLFKEGSERRSLRLVESRAFECNAVLLRYEPVR